MRFKFGMRTLLICLLINAGLVRPAFAVNQQESGTQRQADKTLTFAMVGDVMMGTTFPSVQLPANGGANLFKDAKGVLADADVAVGNLEGALCEGGKTTKGGKNSYAFRTPPSYAQWLKEAGFDFMSMANNHSRDFGDEGILQDGTCSSGAGHTLCRRGRAHHFGSLGAQGTPYRTVCFRAQSLHREAS